MNARDFRSLDQRVNALYETLKLVVFQLDNEDRGRLTGTWL